MSFAGGKYALDAVISRGSFGTVFRGRNRRTGEAVAVKTEPANAEFALLAHEARVYNSIGRNPGFLHIKWYGVCGDTRYMVTPLLGAPLTAAVSLTEPQVREIGVEAIRRVQTLHEYGLVHRDIKPDNFVFDTAQTTLYLIDLGFCTATPDGAAAGTIGSLIGTAAFVSIGVHRRCEPTRRDDIESVGYMLLHLSRGLPWAGIDDECEICEKKCALRAAGAAGDLIAYARGLEFAEAPDYAAILRKLEDDQA